MGRAYKLTWREGENRWRKKYRGRYHYFPLRPGESRVSSYSRVWLEWLRTKAEIDLERAGGPNRETWERILELLVTRLESLKTAGNVPGTRLEWEAWHSLYRRLRRIMEAGGSPPEPADISGPFGEKVREVYLASEFQPDPEADLSPRLPEAKNDGMPAPWEILGDLWEDKTLGGNVDRFLADYVKRKSPGYCDNLRIHLRTLTTFAGPGFPLSRIGEDLVSRYRNHLLGRLESGAFSPEYARGHAATFRLFLRWLWRQRLIEDLPRNLDTREFAFRVTPRKLEVFSPEEVRTILGASPDRSRLYWLLCLNCGFTQVDISTLKQSEVDWREGRITRKRSKTANHGSVPEVSYPLWPETFRLLKAHRSKDSDLALTNIRGGPLCHSKVRPDGVLITSDPIAAVFRRLSLKFGFRGSPKLLRKTAASKLGEHGEFSRFAQHFLGHSPRTVADRHYVRPDQASFDRAVAWLGEEFDVASKRHDSG